MLNWLQQNALSAVGLFLTAYALHAHTVELRIQNLFTISKEHREIWDMLYQKPELRRVLDPRLPLDTVPTFEERHFIRELIFHCAKSFRAKKYRSSFPESGLAEDIREFFSLTVPHAVWNTIRSYQEHDFVDFVETGLQKK